nr:M48 family metallopeptidase [Candidatus Acidoferrales bacterium]
MQPGLTQAARRHNFARRTTAWCAISMLVMMSPLHGEDRTKLKSGWNIFSPDQDIEMGKRLSATAEAQLPMLEDLRVNGYLNRLGRKIAAFAPGTQFPYEFHCVNSKQLNSFALPGGQVYIYRGIIEDADDEAQLAGVMAHEISHVALRHGTNQATRKEMSSGLFGMLGGVVGGGSVSSITSELGGGVIAGSVLVKYTRTSETQADILGTQILYDAGYDPRAMAQFFENAENDSKKKGRVAALFADHPVPERRIERVDEEIDKMGGAPKDSKVDSPEFREIRRYVLSLPIVPERPLRASVNDVKIATPELKADLDSNLKIDPKDAPPTLRRGSADDVNVKSYTGDTFAAKYPVDWEALGRGDSASFVPPDDAATDSQDDPAFARGVLVNIFQPQTSDAPVKSSVDSQPTSPHVALDAATDQLVATLKESSPNLKISGARERIEVDGQAALSVRMTSESPLGGLETDWLVTVVRPEGILYFVCAAPASEYDSYDPVFQKFISSVRLSQ